MTSECDSRDLTPEASATRTILSSPTRATGVLLSVTMTPKNAILRGQRKTQERQELAVLGRGDPRLGFTQRPF